MNMRERSAGVIVYRNGAGGREYLLLRSASGGHWSFPKGRVEPNEDELTTALRELHEETGLTVEIHPGFRAVLTYDFARGGAMFSKEVVYFLGRATSSEVKLSGEHVDYLWAIYARARQRLSFENTQAVLEQAENFLDRLAAS
ncbi:MAG: bis(5'-nucleosyl)-tetraphosphatase [Candidatus Bipolaricaulota bacterium]|nr:bis(5'-nucleosyl)-tetraphosphatase [Candidatus Bipolaricaulota bacterium]MDW8329705.1 bis(5'-nucleosyl)-tetraphosphatase [Candidatus Bipolaricaulota bacterium]